jgi:RES domain-containing protein
VKVWRLLRTRHLDQAWSGEGARLYDGRRNEPGTPVVYLAEHLSLAALEVLVHLDPSDAPDGWTAVPADVREGDIERLDAARLPPGWRAESAPGACAAIGTAWARDARSLLLAVPSVLVPEELVVVLNPRHPGAERVRVGKERPFAFDPRLLPTTGTSRRRRSQAR